MKALLLFICFMTSHVVNSKTESIELLSNIDMLDVGLAKINNDQHYDIYTVNQQNAESILISNNGKFIESGLSLGLKQTIGMPDYESTGRSPKIKKGLNIYSSARGQLVIFCNECDKDIKGTINFPTPKDEKNSTSIIHQEAATFSQKYKIKVGRPFIIMDFELEKNGLIIMDVIYLDLNMEFKIDYPAKGIFLGENSNSPVQNTFSISARDNHSFAWTKLNNDNYTDVYMTSGGLRSRIKEFHPGAVIPGLLYIKDSTTQKFVDKLKVSRIYKESCITYRSEWVDVDSDGDLDLFLGCRNGLNHLHRQYGIGSGKFENIAIDYNFAFHHGEEFEWIDWNNDNAIDLFIIQSDGLYVYKNKITKQRLPLIKKVQTFPDLGKNLNSVNSSIRTFDVNNNGSPEVFVSTKDTIHYFELDDKKEYQKKDLSSLNLPKNLSGNINFVDINLDGYIDICVYNKGIYLQNKDHKFEKSNLYAELFSRRNNRFKSLIWFDADINGQWDVLNAESFKPINVKPKKIKLLSYSYNDFQKWDNLKLHRNISKANKNNWLQIDLEGTFFNRDAIGARITVTTKNGPQQTRFNHGTSDSLHSQGHYRQYFGLNKQTKADITVYWPDGKITTLKDVKANQLLTVKHED